MTFSVRSSKNRVDSMHHPRAAALGLWAPLIKVIWIEGNESMRITLLAEPRRALEECAPVVIVGGHYPLSVIVHPDTARFDRPDPSAISWLGAAATAGATSIMSSGDAGIRGGALCSSSRQQSTQLHPHSSFVASLSLRPGVCTIFASAFGISACLITGRVGQETVSCRLDLWLLDLLSVLQNVLLHFPLTSA